MDVVPNLIFNPGVELAARLQSHAADRDELHEHEDARRLRAKALRLLDMIDQRDAQAPTVEAEATTAEDLTSSIRPAEPVTRTSRRPSDWAIIGCALLFGIGFYVAVSVLVATVHR